MTYRWFDLSELWSCPPGQKVATYVRDGHILCLFNWHFDPLDDGKHFDKIIELPYGPWYEDLRKQTACAKGRDALELEGL